jgi:hypothetical protein
MSIHVAVCGTMLTTVRVAISRTCVGLSKSDIERQHHIGAVVTLLRRHAELERVVARKN